MSKTLELGGRLPYPITIKKLLKREGDPVKRGDALFDYTFTAMVRWGDELHGGVEIRPERTFGVWNSSVDGKVTKWLVQPGQVHERSAPVVKVEETCGHEVQFNGLCANCGADLTRGSWAIDAPDTSRAPINMTHDQTNLMVSEKQAVRAEEEQQRRLLKQRKLTLVVDLDQTIIHACIEPTIGEWQQDPTNPNYDALRDVQKFQLNDDGPRGVATGCWYYIKPRPGLNDFLKRISEKYELHIYTMGTRAYAVAIADIVDPQRKLFGNRIISRDENGTMAQKTLQRLFPFSQNMVVIIDDRSDVWPDNRANLIKVNPYDFFKGIGDINSSFLPKREDLLTPPPGGADDAIIGAAAEAAVANGAALAAEAQMGGIETNGDAVNTTMPPLSLLSQSEEQEKELEKQLTDRPLAHMQEELDKQDEEAERAEAEDPEIAQQLATESSSDESSQVAGGPAASQSLPIHQHHPHHRHQVLRDDDTELFFLERHLMTLHKNYYERYDREVREKLKTLAPPRPGPGGAGRSSGAGGGAGRAGSLDVVFDLESVPDVGEALDTLKGEVLRGVRMVLSGIIPVGVDVLNSEIGRQAMSYGADLMSRLDRSATHLVVSTARPRTAKVRQALGMPHIKIVNQYWLQDSLSQWKKLDETPYLLPIPQDLREPVADGPEQNVPMEDLDSDDEARVRQGLRPLRPAGSVSDTGQIVDEEWDDFLANVSSDSDDGLDDDEEDDEEDDDDEDYPEPGAEKKAGGEEDEGDDDEERADGGPKDGDLEMGEAEEDDGDEDDDGDGAGADRRAKGKRKRDDARPAAASSSQEGNSPDAKKRRVMPSRRARSASPYGDAPPAPPPALAPAPADAAKSKLELDAAALEAELLAEFEKDG